MDNGHMGRPREQTDMTENMLHYLPTTKNDDHVNSLTTLEAMGKMTASSVKM